MDKIIQNPNFNQTSTNQRIVSSGLESTVSLWQIPSTTDHFAGLNTERRHFFDINEANNPEFIERVSREFAERHTISDDEPGSNATLGMRIVNIDKLDDKDGKSKPAIVVFTPWSTDAEWHNTRGTVAALASVYPEQAIIYLETPGMGDSTPLDREAAIRMAKTGSFGPMAEEVSRIFNQSGIKVEVAVGASEGGRLAVSFAERTDCSLVVSVDAPGTHEQPILSFAKKFAIDEGTGQKRVKEASPDTEMVHAHTEHDSKVLAKNGLKNILRMNLVRRARTMAKGGLGADLRRTCASGVKVVDYRAGGSTIADAEQAKKTARSVDGLVCVTLQDAPHALVETNPYGLALLVKEAENLAEDASYWHGSSR